MVSNNYNRKASRPQGSFDDCLKELSEGVLGNIKTQSTSSWFMVGVSSNLFSIERVSLKEIMWFYFLFEYIWSVSGDDISISLSEANSNQNHLPDEPPNGSIIKKVNSKRDACLITDTN